MSGIFGGGAQAPQESQYDKTLASIDQWKENNYTQNYIPLEKAAVNNILTNQPAYLQRGLGMTNANYQQQFAPAQQSVINSTAQRQTGGSGALVSGLGQFAANRGTALGLGNVDTQLGTLNTFANNAGSMLSTGQDQAGTALQSLGTASSNADQQAIIDARAAAAANNALGGMLGSGLGMYAGSQGIGNSFENAQVSQYGQGLGQTQISPVGLQQSQLMSSPFTGMPSGGGF